MPESAHATNAQAKVGDNPRPAIEAQKAITAPTVATKAEVGVEAGEGDSKQGKDYKPRLDDAPSGYTG